MSRQFRSDDTSAWIYGFGDGSDGALTVSSNTTFSTTRASIWGTSGNTTCTAGAATMTDGDLVLIMQFRGTGVGAWELNKVASGGGTVNLTLAHALQNTYADVSGGGSANDAAQIIVLKEYSSVTVNSGITLTAPAWDG